MIDQYIPSCKQQILEPAARLLIIKRGEWMVNGPPRKGAPDRKYQGSKANTHVGTEHYKAPTLWSITGNRDEGTRAGRDSHRGEETEGRASQWASQCCWWCCWCRMHACRALCPVPFVLQEVGLGRGRTSSLSRQTCRTAQEARIPCMEGHARTSG